MNVIISESTQKKLDEIIYGFIKNEESKKDFIKQKTREHLQRYHFKTFDEIVKYLKDGYILFYNHCYEKNANECVLYNPETQMVELWKNEKSDVVWPKKSMTFDEFKDMYFFALLEDGSGYIHKFHKNI